MNQIGSVTEALSMLRRRWWVIALVFVVGCAVALNFALNSPKIYEATAVIQLESPQIAEPTSTTQRTDAAHQLRLIEQRLMARDNLIRIIDKYDLFPEPADLSIGDKVYRLRISASLTQITNAAQSFQPTITPSGLIITVKLDDAQLAADVANEFLGQVVEFGKTRGEVRAREAVAFFQREDARINDEILALESRIADFKQANADSLPSGIASQRDRLATLKETELDIDRQIVELQSNSSRVREAELNRQVTLLEDQKRLIMERVEQIETAIANGPGVEKELNALLRQQTQYQEQYSVITRRKADAEMAQALSDQQQTERFEVLETALVPENPVSRSRKQTALMGAVASLIAAVGLAFLLEVLNPVIRTSAQLEKQLDVQPVISVPVIKSHNPRRLSLTWLLLALGAGLGIAVAAGRMLQDKLSGLVGMVAGRGMRTDP
ncbi:GumC family protein [Pseudaestuariivita atlantica]|uniref:Polysaccharide chain length determinant N-terminal domain-containing protein n=1 Tax=Pseudaestuariivita atlantica TaxID=1317121 RepID=A0A0L1JP41_9RHOB|nr:Wzz/FepE/Etk N-terminal domain-containing protein [Pseudaestuariivita atlantica]KNG93535.1 hypothetical protein ATO11_09965 [Pseudaestuariivita atlantica]